MNFTVENDTLSNGLSLPIDGLSPGAQAIIQGYADGYQCNRDFITASLFTVVSAAVGKRGMFGRWTVQELFPVIRLPWHPSGSNKTTPMREMLRPLSNRNASNYKIFQEEMKKYNAETNAGKENVEKPKFRQLITSDSTPESRIKALSENPNVLLVSDEIATMLYNMNRYNKSGEVPQLISIWSVDDIIINRKSETALLIKEPCLSIIGGTQPDVLSDTFGSDYFMSSGFNQRWLFAHPDDIPPAMYSESKVSKEISDDWEVFINSLLDFDFEGNNYGTLYIRDEAKKLYIDYYNKLQLKKSSACGYMASVYAKLQIMVERWAGITHLFGTPTRYKYNPKKWIIPSGAWTISRDAQKKVYIKLTEAKEKPETKQLTKEQLIAMFYNSCEPKSKQGFADAIGVSRPFVSRAVNKYPMLRCYGYGNDLQDENEQDTIKESVTV